MAKKPIPEKAIDTKEMIIKPYVFSCKELGTFIPYKLAINVGIISNTDKAVIRFIMIFRLLEITDANASIVPLRISLEIRAES